MADDTTIIEGTVKFRDGKKWKSRWCVMRKLSPVADCVQLQLYRDGAARRCAAGAGRGAGKAAVKAALSLQHFLGAESGFTLDKHSNTLALVCTDLVAVLAFETRERLIQWQVKVSAHLGEARHFLVLVGAGGGGKARLAAGPARLHLHERRFALTAGAPPRLLGVWELAHLRRYGVVEGRFCFEGGSHCGRGEGLHVLITDRARELANDFNLASRGLLSPRRRPMRKNDGAESPKSHKAFRPDTRLSELNTIDNSLLPIDHRLYEDAYVGEEAGAISPYWPSDERHFRDMGHGDTASVNETMEGAEPGGGAWGGGGRVSLERCMSCMSKLGALSRSSTAVLTPGATHFSPAWTMDALHEACAAPRTEPCPPLSADPPPPAADACRRPAPHRPPKPTRLDLNLERKPPMPPPTQTCGCSRAYFEDNKSRIGPYENYDVPKQVTTEIDGEYYDTPKRLKECLNNELFKITKSSTPNAVILKKPCGCLLRFGKRRVPSVVDADETPTPACPCRRVTDWANSWIKLPYSRKSTMSSDNLTQNKENSKPDARSALYATIDLSRKTRRKTHPIEPDEFVRHESERVQVDDGPFANYENLNFALSLEYYENAKDLLRRAGVTQAELDAIGASLAPPSLPAKGERSRCARCGHPPAAQGGDYLMMEPKLERSRTPLASAGYTPMSPISAFAFATPKRPARSPVARLLDEKSASNPMLCADDDAPPTRRSRAAPDRADRTKRSSSADSSRFLEDVKEFEGSADRGSSSSIETLRNLAPDDAAACRCAADAGKGSDADSSEASRGIGCAPPPTRRTCAAPGAAGNRDSSSSNDSGVSSCSRGRGAELVEFELPPTTAAVARRHYRTARRAAAARHAAAPRRSRSTDPLHAAPPAAERAPHKSSSAEAEVPVLSVRSLRGIADTHSTSSGTSDMSDYIETLSICSSHSSSEAAVTMRVVRGVTSRLRPRSGAEYLQVSARRPASLAPPAPPAP